MPQRQGSLQPVAPEPIDEEQRPLLDSEHPDHGTISAQQAAEEARATEDPSEHAGPSTGKLLLIMFPMYCSAFFAAADGTIVATLASPIASSFKSFTLVSWIATGYLIANAAFQPLSGRISDIYGRRPGIIFACTFFAVGTLMCGLAKTPGMLIAGRVIAGTGGGCINTLTTFIATDLIPLRRRGLWQGFSNLVYGSGMATGGVVGGLINDSLGWRWAFNIQVPFIVVAGIWAAIAVDIPVKETDKSKIKRVDFAGALTLATSLVLLLLGLNTGGNLLPWSSPLVIVSLVLSILVLLAFIYIEARVASEPIIPVRLLLHRTVMSALLANWFGTMSVFAIFYYAPIYFTSLQHLSSSGTGARLAASSAGTALGSMSAGLIMRLSGRYYWLMAGDAFLSVLSAALIAIFFRPGLALWPPFLILGLHGFAYGALLTISLLALLAAVSHRDQAVITSAQYAFRSTGSTIGITLAAAVFQNVLSNGLENRFGDRPDAGRIIARLRDDPGEIAGLGPRWRKGVEECYADALRGVWGLVLALAAMAAIASLCMREHKLHMTIDRK
ncbi:MFS general substrate transporter [Myriangium duriaei CBS 260.36]|uniref:MFS-type drug efflux transporter P55 n=1 Tax=Myriangium duriaei CBS 260.36 TaxID=1168546 RepID=A0A9P4IW19_9PEZI|nr:MFS general substrate transporter [Myriangium duriaei CBS 260.36]